MRSDICIVGAGAVGCLMAAKLCEKGYDVIVLEAGSGRIPNDFPNDSRDAFRSTGEINYPVNVHRVKAVGGSTNHWGAYLPRLCESDFKSRTLYGNGEDWPIDYSDLEPYYGKAEQELGVSGNDDNELGSFRSTRFPMPTAPIPLALKDKFGKIGISLCSQPRGMTTRVWRGRPPDSMYMAHEVHLAHALATKRLRLITDASVSRLEMANDGKAKQAVFSSLTSNREQAVQADWFVVACGGLESPRLLLLSTSGKFPNGVGNGSGHVGKHFMEHPRIDVTLFFDSPFCLPFNRVLSFQHYNRTKNDDRGALLLTISGQPTPKDFIRQYYWGDKLREKILQEANRELYVACTIEDLPDKGNYVTLDAEKKDIFGKPVLQLNYSFGADTKKVMQRGKDLLSRIAEKLNPLSFIEGGPIFLSHHLGTCRMSSDPANGVVSPNLVTHDVPNVMVVGTSNFVTGGAVNPTLTAAALTLRAVDFLIKS